MAWNTKYFNSQIILSLSLLTHLPVDFQKSPSSYLFSIISSLARALGGLKIRIALRSLSYVLLKLMRSTCGKFNLPAQEHLFEILCVSQKVSAD